MAKDILSLSNSYLEYLRKRRESRGDDILKRRLIVIEYLNDEYLLSENVLAAVLQRLKKEGFTVSRQTVSADIQVYRSVFLYFHGFREKISQKIAEKNWTTMGLSLLLQDGFDSWEKIMAGLKSPAKKSSRVSKRYNRNLAVNDFKPIPVDGNSVKDMFNLLEFVDAFDAEMNNSHQQIATLQISLRRSEEKLRKRDLLITKLQDDLDTANQLIAIGDEEITRLQDLLIEKEAMATLSPDIQKKLMELVELLGEAPLKTTPDAIDENNQPSIDQAEELSEESTLPRDCKHFGKRFLYTKTFRKFYEGLDDKTTRIVIKALENFSEHGPRYGALGTVKHIGETRRVEMGAWKSRAGLNLRFLWRDLDNGVEVYDLFSRENV